MVPMSPPHTPLWRGEQNQRLVVLLWWFCGGFVVVLWWFCSGFVVVLRGLCRGFVGV